MRIEPQIRESEQLIQWLASEIEGLEIPANDRSRLAAGCLDTALEHHRAIVLLTANVLYGSAAALVRLLFEAYVRGVWLFHAASDEEIGQFKDDKLNKAFGELIADLENVEPFKGGTLSHVKEVSWKAMNSLTHSGLSQVARRITSDAIMPNYTDEELKDVLETANSLGVLAAIDIADMAGNEELACKVFDRGMKLFKNKP
jgi:hypothetical protein